MLASPPDWLRVELPLGGSALAVAFEFVAGGHFSKLEEKCPVTK